MHQNALICIGMRMLKNNTTFVKKQHISRIVHLVLQHCRCGMRSNCFSRSALVDSRNLLNRWRTIENVRRDARHSRTQVLLDLLGPSLAVFRRCPRMPQRYRPAWLPQLIGCWYCSNFGRLLVLLDLLGPSLAVFRRCPRMPQRYRPASLPGFRSS